ncbi:MAG: SDR family NAD(P)-dependent oxidoreductase [Propionibacteriaceae bacterium]|jgi:ketoreductase|nr:SDR family NAD(P)-dependent oxidoreductase [Propionibacteriaceae bacterium]
MSDRWAFLTGATGDIGAAIARVLIEEGMNVFAVARGDEGLDLLRSDLDGKAGAPALRTCSCDVKSVSSVSQAVAQAASVSPWFEVLVNCAGVPGGGVTAQLEPRVWDNVIATNLNGVFYVTHEFLARGMIVPDGRIVNIASTAGKQGVLNGAAYSASKHGVLGFTRSLGLELARNGSGITVNAVCPGFVESRMAREVRELYAGLWGTDPAETKRRVEERIPIGRYVEPGEVAEMVRYLVSSGASAVTAQAFNVCGGLATV